MIDVFKMQLLCALAALLLFLLTLSGPKDPPAGTSPVQLEFAFLGETAQPRPTPYPVYPYRGYPVHRGA